MFTARSWPCALLLAGAGTTGCILGPSEPEVRLLECLHGCESVTVVDDEPGPLLIGEERVYWASLAGDTGKVMSAPASGGEAQVIASFEAGALPRLALDATHVYWIEPRLSGAVRSALLDGSAVTTLADEVRWPTSVVVDEESAYFTVRELERISRVPLAGGPVTRVDGDYPYAFEALPTLAGVSEGKIYGTTTVPGEATFFGDPYSALWAVPIEGGELEVVADFPGEVYGFAETQKAFFLTVDSMDLLNVEPTGKRHRLMEIPKKGEGPAHELPGIHGVWTAAVDESGVYFTELTLGVLHHRAEIDDLGTLRTLVSKLDGPRAMALDAGHVYWTHRVGEGWAISRTEK